MSGALRKVFVVDVEATSRTPMTGVMTEFAISHVDSGDTFYAHLYDTTKHPNIPALPVLTLTDDGEAIENLWTIPYVPADHTGRTFAESWRPYEPASSPDEVVRRLTDWLAAHHSGQPMLLSDNIMFDGMWLNSYLDMHDFPSLFGYSGRRIGDFYAGLRQDFWDANSWKKLDVGVRHTHYPADDAYANVLKFRRILALTGNAGVGTLFDTT